MTQQMEAKERYAAHLTQMEALMADWQRRAGEPLVPELAMCVYDDGPCGRPILSHPLVIEVMFDASSWLAPRVNDQLATKKEIRDKARAEGDWWQYVNIYEKPYRLDALAEVAHEITDDREYWQQVSDILTGTENFWQHRPALSRLLLSDRPGREHMMTDDERGELAKMPDRLTVHRGFNGKGTARGWSWTLNHDQAVWFAARYAGIRDGKPPTVVTGTVLKRNVIAYLTGRNEAEIIARPERVKVTDRQEPPQQQQDEALERQRAEEKARMASLMHAAGSAGEVQP